MRGLSAGSVCSLNQIWDTFSPNYWDASAELMKGLHSVRSAKVFLSHQSADGPGRLTASQCLSSFSEGTSAVFLPKARRALASCSPAWEASLEIMMHVQRTHSTASVLWRFVPAWPPVFSSCTQTPPKLHPKPSARVHRVKLRLSLHRADGG